MQASHKLYQLVLLFPLFTLLSTSIFAQSNLVISGVIDGPLSGGVPKAIELYALDDIPDLSIYGVGSANNGGGTDGEEFTFPADALSAGQFIYIASESVGFTSWFGFAPDYTSSSASINGDDAIELFLNGSVVDVFGDINVDGTGQPWEYLDGWAYRVDETGPDGSLFNINNWTFSGPNALDGETTNATATVPFPTSSFVGSSGGGDDEVNMVITGVVDGPLSGGLPKTIEVYVLNNIADLSIYGLGSANNGGGSDGEEFTFPAGGASAGEYLYITTDLPSFNTFFGFEADYENGSAPSINGDDAIELFLNGSVVDVFGDINTDGTGQPWEYLDGWAYRVPGTGPDGTTFELGNWTFSGPNALDGESNNDDAATPFPAGSYGGEVENEPVLILSGVIDGPLTGGLPKAVEFYATEDIDDLSLYGFGSANNGGGTDGEEFTFPADNVSAGTFLYVASESAEFQNFFGFAPDYISGASNVNGDDAIELFFEGAVIDVFGDINVDGTGQPWEYADGWAYRVNGTGPDGSTFSLGNWMFSGPNALDNETTNGTATNPFPNGSYSEESGPVGPQVVKIHEVQGSGLTVVNPGTEVIVEAVVIGDYQEDNQLDGFFIQEETTDEDGNNETSEGIFVFCGSCPVDVQEGNRVHVRGIQEEFFGMSQIDVTFAGEVSILDGGNNLVDVTPVAVNLPAPGRTDEAGTLEAYEGMLIQIPQQLTATEYFQLARFGQVVLSEGGRLDQFTQQNFPSVSGFSAYQDEIAARRIILDDLNNFQNFDPVYHPQPGGFAVDNFFRGGYTINNLTGVLHWSWAGAGGTDAWRIRPQITAPPSFTPSNPREELPESVDGDIRVASFNVLNYFNGDGQGGGFPTSRGADSPAEFERQTAKIVDAIIKMNADIIGLVEIENDYIDGPNSAIASLVDALNATPFYDDWKYVDPGQNVGTDVIAVGFIYRGDVFKVHPGTVPAILDDAALPALDLEEFAPLFDGDATNRAALAASFRVKDVSRSSKNERLTIVINHFKSKGSSGLPSSCADPNCDQGDGQGFWNDRRTQASIALAAWLETQPTGLNDPDFLILGDLNAYALEDPIAALQEAGYTNLNSTLGTSEPYSFVFDGQWGTLDYALANEALLPQVAKITEWHINADEVNLLDYNDPIQDPGEAFFEAKPGSTELFAPDAFRSSDHDPVIVGLNLDKKKSKAINKFAAELELQDNLATAFHDIHVYPNPASDRLWIALPEYTDAAATIDIIDALGKAVKSHRGILLSGPVTLDIAQLPSGTYHVRIVSGQSISMASFVVQ